MRKYKYSYRVLRAGGYHTFAEYCRSAFHNCYYPGYRGTYLGFRLAVRRVK